MADDTAHVRYGQANGQNDKTITLSPAPINLVEGFALSFKNITQNTGAVTINVNGLGAKPVVKSNGNALVTGNLKAGSIYTVRYDGSNFILQGEGGSGNAVASDLLSGKTATTDAGDIVGTMPNRGTFNLELGASVPAGYYSGGNVPNGKRIASGTKTSVGNELVVTGLPFKPSKLKLTYTMFNQNYNFGMIQFSSEVYAFGGPVGGTRSFKDGSFTADGFTAILYTNNNNVVCTWEATE